MPLCNSFRHKCSKFKITIITSVQNDYFFDQRLKMYYKVKGRIQLISIYQLNIYT